MTGRATCSGSIEQIRISISGRSRAEWAGSQDIGSHPSGWQPAASGDFNGDGTSDVLWYNPSNGNVDIWKIANGQWAGSVDVGLHPLGWQPAGSGDFNNDGTDDVLWYNPSTGNVDIWKLSNGAVGRQPGHRPASARMAAGRCRRLRR